MRDHSHSSRVQGSNRDLKEEHGCREEARIIIENMDKKIDEMKDMFNQFMKNQDKGKGRRDEE